MKLKYQGIIVILCVLWACDNTRVYEENHDFESKFWASDSVSTFTFNIEDVNQDYSLLMNIRNTNTYAYHNLYVQYTLEDTVGNILKKELVSNNLFHEKTGKPLGSGLGDIFSHQFALIEGYTFENPSVYKVTLQQFMRQDSLQGILSAGIRIEETSSNN